MKNTDRKDFAFDILALLNTQGIVRYSVLAVLYSILIVLIPFLTGGFIDTLIYQDCHFFCPPQTLEFKAHFPSRPAGDWGTFGAQMGHNRGFAGVP